MTVKPKPPAHHSAPAHHAPPKPASAPPSHAHAASASAPSSASAHPHAHAPNQGHSRSDTFERLDRNQNGRIDLKEIAVSRKPLTKPVHIHGDTNHNGSISRKEFNQLTRHMDGFDENPGHRPTSERHAVFKMPAGHSATIRTHDRGMVKGRVQPGDKFIVTHQRGPWVYGHVKGHADRQGWVLRESLPKHALRKPSAAELNEGSRKPIDYRNAGLSFTTHQDRKVLDALQNGMHGAGKHIGYTTPVRQKPRDPSAGPMKLYANFPLKPENVLKRDGKELTIPPDADVKFRYTPDGKAAVVLVMLPGHKDGVWGMVPMSELEIPKGTVGAQAPVHPIRG